MAPVISASLGALLRGAIDYAGLFPPASLPLPEALAQFSRHLRDEHAWMLGRFIVSAKDLAAVPANLDGRLSVLSDQDHARASALETRAIPHLAGPKPVYCEVAPSQLADVCTAGHFAKVRTGGVTPDAVPTSESLAHFIAECARHRLPFKATAGLHHPIRAMHSPEMHGFVNILAASAFAWKGFSQPAIQQILDERDPAAFGFDSGLSWRDHHLTVHEVAAARRDFIHSFGSCSFAEPIADLQHLGWL